MVVVVLFELTFGRSRAFFKASQMYTFAFQYTTFTNRLTFEIWCVFGCSCIFGHGCYYSWNVTNHMRPTISGPDLRYQAPTYDIRPRPTISGPKTKQRFRSCSKRFSPRTASKIHEHFDQQNGTKFFLPQLCFIPFSICQVSSKIVKQRRSTWPLRRSYSWSR